MALDPLQEQITQTALSLPQAHTLALAGGGAMIAHGLVDRATHDVDLFTEIDPDEAVKVAAALRGALTAAGLEITPAARPPHANRFVVRDPRTGLSCEVEVFPDGGRLRPTVDLELGAVLHLDDLAADKVLALWGRAEVRDYIDVVALLDRIPKERLLQLAVEKDAGFTSATFRDALEAIRRFDPEDWTATGIDASSIDRTQQTVAEWIEELDD
ncbi:nucleotidyl transferase AbiEii/AbiGii toxin family protein [Cryptosporangium sp. NPDC048952]|uniref:nucleotidyl transferase AbiEii/AbiGii toxin family protein n=1 Tax=Cryptosporangium sp. NPDC048952 TaxID=3363961 RepID=UPI003713764D